jgi:hypothetical protein
MAASPPLDLDTADALDRITLPGLGIGRSQAPHIKADLQMSDPLALPAPSRFVSDG